MEETDAAAPFLLTGEPAVWLDTVFFPCAHVPLVTVIQFPLHLVGKNEICLSLKLLHHERGMYIVVPSEVVLGIFRRSNGLARCELPTLNLKTFRLFRGRGLNIHSRTAQIS